MEVGKCCGQCGVFACGHMIFLAHMCLITSSLMHVIFISNVLNHVILCCGCGLACWVVSHVGCGLCNTEENKLLQKMEELAKEEEARVAQERRHQQQQQQQQQQQAAPWTHPQGRGGAPSLKTIQQEEEYIQAVEELQHEEVMKVQVKQQQQQQQQAGWKRYPLEWKAMGVGGGWTGTPRGRLWGGG